MGAVPATPRAAGRAAWIRSTFADPPASRVLGLIAAFGLALLALLLAADRARPGGRAFIKLAGADEICYYSVARSLLVDGDLDLSNEYARLRPDPTFAVSLFSIVPETGRPRSVFPIGFSLLELPFLAAGQAVARATGAPTDGYSHACVTAFFVGVLTFLCLGLAFLFLFLRDVAATVRPGSPSTGWAALVTLALWPSTTLLYYTFTLLSQVAAFMATALYLWTWWRARQSDSAWQWLGAGAAAGLMFLCRWQNVLFLTVVAGDEAVRLWRDRPSWGRWLRSRVAFAAAFAVVLLPQLIEWKAIFGRFLTMPQGADFFAFPPPHLLRVLISSQNGWFTWTPIAALGMMGLVLLTSRRPRLGLPLLAAVVLQWITVASLSRAWHGHLFGMRTLTSCVTLVGVGVLVLLLWLSRRGQALVVGLIAACCAYTVLFAAQYRLDLVPKEDRLTAQELVGDKLRPGRAWQRRRAWAEAKRLADEDPARGAAMAQEAVSRYGPDRNLLALLAEARGRAGDLNGRGQAEADLRRLLELRLY